MDSVPKTPDEYRVWWKENVLVPYGFCWCGCGKKTNLARQSHTKAKLVRGEPVRFVQDHWRKGRRFPWSKKRERMVRAHKERWRRERPNIPYGYCWCGCGQRTNPFKSSYEAGGEVEGEPKRYIGGHQSGTPYKVLAFELCYAVKHVGYKTPCWIWQRGRTTARYGTYYDAGCFKYAHIATYERAYGPVPVGLELDHLCKNPPCCNPEHLEAVTHTENLRRGRRAKLDIDKARSIRQLRHENGMTYKELAEKFCVSTGTISGVLAGRVWKE